MKAFFFIIKGDLMSVKRAAVDLEYILLNHFVNKIPSWIIRKCIYKLAGMTLGKDSRIGIGTVVISPRHIFVGKGTIINEYCHLDGRGGLKIGNYSSVSIYSKILTASHHANSPKFEYYTKEVNIGNNVWLGCNATILDGSVVHDFAIIGAGSVFKGIAKKGEIYIGNPASMLKKRDIDEHYEIKYSIYFR